MVCTLKSSSVYEQLATILTYPRAGYGEHCRNCASALVETNPLAAKEMEHFLEKVKSLSLHGFQELFTRTFDLNPSCVLELGWHLFGETYERGSFMVKMRKMLAVLGIEESGELADHFSHALLALHRLTPTHSADFWRVNVQPALKKMMDAMEGKENPYKHVIAAIHAFLQARHGEVTHE